MNNLELQCFSEITMKCVMLLIYHLHCSVRYVSLAVTFDYFLLIGK